MDLTNSGKLADVQCEQKAGDTSSNLVFDRDASLGYLVLNRREMSLRRKSDAWFLAIGVPVVIVLGLATLACLLLFLAGLGPHGC